MKSVFRHRFAIDPSLPPPNDADWDRVRSGVSSLRGDVSDQVRSRLSDVAARGGLSPDAYFARDQGSIGIGGFAIGRADRSVLGTMKADLRVGGFQAGRIDSFDVAAMRETLADASLVLDASVRADLDRRVADYAAALKSGDIKSGTYVDKEGAIHELTEGTVDVSYEALVQIMNPADWSPNLPRYKGGEVREIESIQRGDVTEIRQQERMSLDAPPNNLDMTKNSIVEVGPTSARVSWHVFHSDPTALTFATKSVLQDDGYIDFQKTDDGKVLVRCHSKHKISTPGTKLARFMLGQRLADGLTGELGLRGYFTDVIKRYRDIGEGRIAPASTDRAP